jgi:hypothetical protein
MMQMGEDEDDSDDYEWEPVEPTTSPCDSVSGLNAKKSV